ncbi:hypothetical protein FISHEDRAFT_76438 [Fistulina hepatica ATCC 64428]|uniref:Uncharacterized protein n=1 Tax=Fistulina hepatica ATCC 64428 TaxID=1128425 RepID=A0A0D7A5C9_9AGAR|nr:hypothetical protein FISHEDRAFT_76438 [Fistulina hepatica ATCC 64428]
MATASLESPHYFGAPVETLVASCDGDWSTEITLHDIAEAYNTLLNRFRSQIKLISDIIHEWPALACVRENASMLTRALCRDMRRVVVDAPVPSCLASDIMLCVSSSPMPFLAQPSRAATQLHTLLDCITEVGGSRNVLDQPRVRHFVAWTLKVQALPPTISALWSKHIMNALRMCMEQDPETVAHALQAIHVISSKHAAAVFPTLPDTLPLILLRLLDDVHMVRCEAAYALGGLALGKLADVSQPPDAYLALAEPVHLFIAKHRASLHELLSGGFAGEKCFVYANKVTCSGPIWATMVVLALVVLTDHTLFTNRHSLKLFIQPTASAHVNPHASGVPRLVANVWKALGWAFARLNGMLPSTAQASSTVASAFSVLIQEPRFNAGIALVARLLETRRTGDVPRRNIALAIKAVNGMLTRPETLRDGLGVLCRLLVWMEPSNSVELSSAPVAVIPAAHEALFERSMLFLCMDMLPSTLHSLPDVQTRDVSCLSEAQTLDHWSDLLDLWAMAADLSLGDLFDEFLEPLTFAWQTLLLVQRRFTQKQSHLEPTPDYVDRIAVLSVQMLSSSLTPNRLVMATRMWSVIKNVFAPVWLPGPARALASTLMAQQPSDLSVQVQQAWCELLAALTIMINDNAVLNNMFTDGDSGAPLHRKLWVTLVQLLFDGVPTEARWEFIVDVFVVCTPWELTRVEHKNSTELLNICLIRAQASGSSPQDVVEHIAQRVSPKAVLPIEQVHELLKHVNLTGRDAICEPLFQHVNVCLTANYPPGTNVLTTCLAVFHLLTQIVEQENALVVPFLDSIMNSICLWTSDEHYEIVDADYNESIIPLYCRSLVCLRSQRTSRHALQTLMPYLTTPFFDKMPAGALGPHAFHDFWLATYAKHPEFSDIYSPGLKDALRSLEWLYDGDATTITVSSGIYSSPLVSRGDVFLMSDDSQQSNQTSVVEETQSDSGRPDTTNIDYLFQVMEEATGLGVSAKLDATRTFLPASPRPPVDATPARRSPVMCNPSVARTSTCIGGERFSPEVSLDSSPCRKRKKSGDDPDSRMMKFSCNFLPSPATSQYADSVQRDEEDYDAWERGITAEDIEALGLLGADSRS